MKKSVSSGDRLVRLDKALRSLVPHLFAVCSDEEGYRGLSMKVKPDGTTLVVLKSYFPDGGESVCFGVGYGLVGALLGVDATVQAGNWKVDKPWRPKERGK